MNQELTLAIAQLLQRPVERTWFIPVRFSDCDIPDRGIGSGETLRDLQWVDLFRDWAEGLRKILRVVQTESSPGAPPDVVSPLSALEPELNRISYNTRSPQLASQKAGDLAENLVSVAFVENDWIVNPQASDYGYDFFVQHMEPDGGAISALLQVKALLAPIRAKGMEFFRYSLEVRYLDYWSRAPEPTYLCVVEVPTRDMFVVSVKGLVDERAQRVGKDWDSTKSRSIRVPLGAKLTTVRFSQILDEVRAWWAPILFLRGYGPIPTSPPSPDVAIELVAVPSGLTVDEPLRSDLFGLVPARSPHTAKLISRYCELVTGGAAAGAAKEHREIEDELPEMPPLDEGEIKRWVEETVRLMPSPWSPPQLLELIKALGTICDNRERRNHHDHDA